MTTKCSGATGLSGLLVLFMSVAAGLGTSTIYVLQPAVADVADSLASRTSAVGVALALGPIGYMVGLAVLVPLVDRFAPSRVLAAQFGTLATALAITAAAGNVGLLGAVMAVTGAFSAVGAAMSSIGGRFASVHRRATTLGIVTAGISAGILAGRLVGGWLADQWGWRAMLLLFAAACAALALCCLALLPATRGGADGGYFADLRSLPMLVVRSAALRQAAVRGALWFFAFCALWAALAVALSEPPYSYSAERIGLYALAGLSGLAATQIAGLWTDRVGAQKVILLGLSTSVCAAALAAVVLDSTGATLLCLAIFDAGLFAAQVANQSTVLAIDPAAPARFNSAYMVVYFVGGSLGTAFGAAAVEWFGWFATAMSAAAAIGAAAVLTATTSARRTLATHQPSLAADPRE
ncbi:MFS transporter [Mycobacterium deserti]|uniref:MFS transporter n=1 Tax=Mycobacterium deserti TaxID=2978347 RepID=A0ABT2MD03_9MYCO|nr:MFS transporter [Mycobacterium deserti]MCT7660149.1 MFS transporter [Mycobacterium deserti]